MPPTTPITAFARPEYIGSVPFTANTLATLPSNGGLLPNNRFMSAIMLEFRGRLTMPASTGPSAAQGDSLAAIMERVQIEGYHTPRRQQERFIDMRGADLELLQRIYLPGTLIKTPTISVTANATNDIIVQVYVPFVPMRMPVGVQAKYLLDAPNYESLKLSILFGDYTSVVVPGTTAATFSAYGSTTGSPEVRVYGFFAIQSQRFAGFLPGRIFRTFTEITGSPMTTTANEVRLWDIPRGNDIRAVILKTGVKSTVATSGVNTFSSLTDFLTDIRINQGLGNYIRRYLDGYAVYADLATSYNLSSRITGLNPIDFAQLGAAGEVLSTRKWISGPTGNVELYVQANVAGASNQTLVAMLEEWRYRPNM